MHPKNLSIAAYNYHLPESNIAKYPLQQRDASKLLVWNKGEIEEATYQKITQFLPNNSMLVFNETKVVNARLSFQKRTGGKIEIFCLEPDSQYADITTAMLQQGSVYWKCLVGGLGKWKHDEEIIAVAPSGQEMTLRATIHQRLTEGCIIHFTWDQNISFSEVLQHIGSIPIPPYLNRAAEEADTETYQTIFAVNEGSVAAPTAALHFTPQLLDAIQQAAHTISCVTLHVGAGTFKPVKATIMDDHEMHAEYLEVSLPFLQQLQQHVTDQLPVVAIGTTSVRTLESLYWIGCKIAQNPTLSQNELAIPQWMPYDSNIATLVPLEAIQHIIHYLQQQKSNKLITKTQIIIAPGYRFKIINSMVTNFHQPQSTLLLLVSALIGDAWKDMYQYALDHNFRFLSYGDGCLLTP